MGGRERKRASSHAPGLTVVAYDVGDDRTRQRIACILLGAGARRIQKSVFELNVDWRTLARIRQRLKRLCRRGDSIVYYTLCARCRKSVIYEDLADD